MGSRRLTKARGGAAAEQLRPLGELIAWSAGVSFVTALVGRFWFARRDV